MQYELSIKERLLLLNILPAEGNLLTIRIVRELREGLSFSEEEHADSQMVEQNDRVTWKEGSLPPKQLDIGPKAVVLIQDRLRELDKDKKLSPDHLDLWDLFECDKGA